MILRMFAMVLAAGAAVLQVSRGAWLEATGLLGLCVGLLILRVWPDKRGWASIAFGITAAAIAAVLLSRTRG